MFPLNNEHRQIIMNLFDIVKKKAVNSDQVRRLEYGKKIKKIQNLNPFSPHHSSKKKKVIVM